MQEVRRNPTKSSLTPSRLQLVELMQRVNFGRVDGLVISNGDPVLDPPPRVVREVKFGGENGPHPRTSSEDFLLKSQVRELFAQFDELGDRTIHSIEIKHGLPFRMTVEEDTAA